MSVPEQSRSDAPAVPDRHTLGRRTGVRGWTARRPLTAFLVLVFGITWPVLAVLVLAAHGVIPGGHMPVEPFALGLTLLVLLPAALWVTAVTEGHAEVRRLVGRALRWRFGWGWWVVVLLALPVTTIALGVAFGGYVNTASLLPVLGQEALLLVAAVVLVNLWEEAAWGGFLQTRLERRHNLVVAAVLTAVPFAGVHMPLLLLGDITVSSVLLGIGGLLILGVLVRLMAGVVLRGATDSVLAIGVLHAVFDASNNPGSLVDNLLDGANQEVFILVAVVLVTAITALTIRSRLTSAYRQTVLEQTTDSALR